MQSTPRYAVIYSASSSTLPCFLINTLPFPDPFCAILRFTLFDFLIPQFSYALPLSLSHTHTHFLAFTITLTET